MGSTDRPILLCNVDYPLYSVRILSERHIIVAGGGGASNTGVRNYADIFELVYDPEIDACRAVPVARLNTDKRAIMNMCIIPHSNFHFSLLTGGAEGLCQVYDVKLQLKGNSERRESVNSENDFRSRNRSSSVASNSSEQARSLRKRLNSTSRSSSIDEESNRENEIPPTMNGTSGPGGDPNAHTPLLESLQNLKDSGIPEYAFEFVPVQTFQTDFHRDAHQKLIKYSSQAKLLFTAGSDFTIRIWNQESQSGKWQKVREIVAHDRELDDLDIHPVGQQVVSCGRDGKIMVWNVNTGKLITSPTHEPVLPKAKPINGNAPVPIKYIARAVRYGIEEGDISKVRLYCLLNPLSLSSASTGSFISKWDVQDERYTFSKIAPTGKTHLSTLGISDNGQFLAVGDNKGTVDVYIAFSLKRCYHMSGAHQSIFITGLEFLPTSVPSLELVGANTEASLVSISVDNRVILHRLIKRPTLEPLSSFFAFVIFMISIYIGMSLYNL